MKRGLPSRYSWILIFVLVGIAFIFSGCIKNDNKSINNPGLNGGGTKPFRVGVIMSLPDQKGHINVNDAALAGVLKAEEELGIEYQVLNPNDLVNDVESFRYFAENNFDLIIAAGSQLVEDLNKVALKYKDRKFTIIEGRVNQPNVTSIMFTEEEGGFLAGVTAGYLTKTQVVGFIGGAQVDKNTREYQNGFLKGLQFVNNQDENKNVRAFISNAGVFIDSLYKPEKGKELAWAHYSNGADIIFQTAGETGNGVYMAAQEFRKYVIGNNTKQAEMAPWNSYGTVINKVDMAVFNTIKAAYEKKLKEGLKIYGIKDNGVDFLPNETVPKEVQDQINGVKNNLAKGAIDLSRINVSPELELKLPEKPEVNQEQANAGQPSNINQNNTPTPNNNQNNNNQKPNNQQTDNDRQLTDAENGGTPQPEQSVHDNSQTENSESQ